jgi:hypothetical protein
MPDEILDRIARALAAAQSPAVVRSQPVTGGLNNRYSPLYIGEDQYAECVNGTLDDLTRPSLRDGYSVMPNMSDGILGSTTFSGVDHSNHRIAGAAELHTSAGNKFMFIAVDATASGECFYRTSVGSGGAWSIATVDGTNSLAVQTDEAIVFQANDGLVIIPDESLNLHTFDDTGALNDGDNINTSPPRGVVDGCYMLSRIWLFKDGTATTPPELHYSKLLPDMSDPSTQFNRDGISVSTTIAGRLQLSPNRSGQARAVEPWNETSLMVFFDSSIEEILIISANPQADSLRRVIEPNIGCASPQAVVSVGQEMYFMDQYGQVRSLQQTVTSAQGGVVAKPLSEPIAAEIPGRVNLDSLRKCRMAVYKDKLYVAYPRNASEEATAVAVFSLAYRIWEAIWLPAHALGQFVLTDMRGRGEDLWTADGGSGVSGDLFPAAAKLYRWFPGTYTDDGSSIDFLEVSRAFHLGVPEADKIADWLEIEASGSAQVQAQISINVNESGPFTKLDPPFVIDVPAGGSFPLIDPDDFPVIDPDDFPLVDSVNVGTTRKKYSLYPLEDSGRGRAMQVKIEVNSESGKQFKRSGYRMMLRQEPYEGS